ncbi:C1 family peptidase [Ferruginibacter sp. SUN106]|uniref:C1 family peptidase n=1 Tax=Ferruginibacter sp. SUN106 TaxID=2978348 RepID=UPI003D362F1E
MPIRMVDDQENQDDYNEQNDNSGGRGGSNSGGGAGGLLNFLPLILGLFRGGGGGGKKIIFLLVIAGAAFFLMRNQSCAGLVSNAVSQFATGGKLDPNEFKKASVYEGLTDDNGKNPLPEAVSLARYAPDRLNQGHQGSCVAWSSAYAARTILQSTSTHENANTIAYSPSFLYNNIGLDGCEGSYIIKAMEFMQQKGAVPLQQFPYTDQSCSDQGHSLLNVAANNKIHGFNRLTDDDGVSVLNFRAIKEHLAKDAPVVIGMMVGGSFMQDMMGQKVWHPTQDDYTMQGFGGHAMCVIGYDDRIEGGAFQIMNSWGPEWGDKGLGYIRYGDFRKFVREAYGIDPLPKTGAALNVDFECNIGLVNGSTKQYIALRAGSGNVFTTVTPIKKGTKFRIELKNALECYAYIFGMETDNSSYVLFPYKPIHSPYFGVTGYRLFPRKEALMADSIGNKDFMAIVVSKQPLDYAALNAAINKSTQSTYAGKLNEAISSMAISNVKFSNSSTGNIYFKADASEQKNVVGCVVEIDKN